MCTSPAATSGRAQASPNARSAASRAFALATDRRSRNPATAVCLNPLINARRRLRVDAVLPGDASSAMSAPAVPLARLPLDGDALREGAGRGNSGSRARADTRWAVSPAPSAREPAVAVREAPRQGAARRRAFAARARVPSNRALHRVRRSALRLCARLLRRLWPRLPARVLLQLCAGWNYAQLPVRKCRIARMSATIPYRRRSGQLGEGCADALRHHRGSPTAHNQREFKNCST